MDPPIRVLVVEDDPLVLRYCECVLERAGYAVSPFADGSEALLAQPDVRLAIVDLILPGAHGAEVVRCLRERGMTAPVVCISGYPLADMAEIPSAYFLAKPFSPEQLLAIVEIALEEAA
jgi:DNA-binding response OmpR family regulator